MRHIVGIANHIKTAPLCPAHLVDALELSDKLLLLLLLLLWRRRDAGRPFCCEGACSKAALMAAAGGVGAL